MAERACVVFNLTALAILQTLPPKYSYWNVMLLLVQTLQVFCMGPVFFVLKLRNQIKQFDNKKQSIKDLLDVVNGMNIGFFVFGAYGIWSSVNYNGTIFLAPNVVMTLNLMVVVENIGDFMLKYNANRSKFQTKKTEKSTLQSTVK
ncbi:hypothetical protein O9G_005120 [Rozella allomycis CSF55]|uniref:Uncharacterized protein n=2 Tax=Rozella allomycis (strain CSF55) TaxID=988480 RepID=A0A075AV89_ROZAC|nr:hypothetical protein O9G_005120 [Rozella allomycis CSF55]|eukprot:EPZ34163.1 hypothetical protein O9G_005120 [Rozella allomycis CSF55]